MTLIDVKSALIALLQTEFPASTMNYYGLQVVEGYERPCFFTQIQPVSFEPTNYNSRKTQILFYITYMQSEVDEADMYHVIDTVRDLFGLSVQVGDRAIKVNEMDYDFIGTERNILEMSFDMTWYDRIEHIGDYETMETLEINEQLEE